MVLSIPCIKVFDIEHSGLEFKRLFVILHLLICLSVFCHLVFIDFLWNRIDGRRTLWDRAVVAPSVSLLCLVQLRSANIYPSLAMQCSYLPSNDFVNRSSELKTMYNCTTNKVWCRLLYLWSIHHSFVYSSSEYDQVYVSPCLVLNCSCGKCAQTLRGRIENGWKLIITKYQNFTT